MVFNKQDKKNLENLFHIHFSLVIFDTRMSAIRRTLYKKIAIISLLGIGSVLFMSFTVQAGIAISILEKSFVLLLRTNIVFRKGTP